MSIGVGADVGLLSVCFLMWPDKCTIDCSASVEVVAFLIETLPLETSIHVGRHLNTASDKCNACAFLYEQSPFLRMATEFTAMFQNFRDSFLVWRRLE